MSKGKKIALGIVIFFAVVVVALAIAIPILFDVDRYRPQVIAHIEETTGKPAEIGKLALTVFPTLSIRVDDFALGNPKGFPEGYLVKTERIYAVVDGGELWDRRVVIKSLELEKPVIRLLSNARGKWNFENPPQPKKTAETPDEPSSFTLGIIPKVSIQNGDFEAANLTSSGRPEPNFTAGRGISIDLEDVDINAFISETAASLLPRHNAPPHFTSRSLGTTLLYAAPPPAKPAAQGTLRADSLSFGTFKATSVRTKMRLFPKQVFFDDLNFDLYGGHASGDISLNLAGRSPRYTLNARLGGVDVARMLEDFPDARGMMTGRLEGDMKLSGVVVESPDPLAGMRGTGKVSIKDGELPSLQLNKNLMTLARLSSLGPAEGDPSSFQSMSTDLNIANGKVTSNEVTIVGNGVDIDGAGALSLAGAGSLDYEGTAKLAAQENQVTNVLANLSGATFEDGKMTFPFTIGGTLENPRFKLKSLGSKQQITGIQKLLGGQQQAEGEEGQTDQQSPADLVQGITGLFKKKKTAE